MPELDSSPYWVQVLRNVAEAVIVTDQSGNVCSMNPCAEELTGLDEAHAVGKPIAEIITTSWPGALAHEIAVFLAAVLGDATTAVDYERRFVICCGKREIAVRGKGLATPKQGSNVRHVVFTFCEEISSEADVSTNFFKDSVQSVLDRITDLFSAVDRDWRITFINRRTEEVLAPLSRGRADLIGENIWEVFPNLVGSPVYDAYQRAMRDQVPVSLEFHFPPIDRWFDIHVYPSNSGLSIFSQDITARKRAEQEARENMQWFSTTLSSIGDAVMATDSAGCVTFMNPVAEHITGWTLNDIRLQPLYSVFRIVNEFTRQPVEDPVQKVLRTGTVVGLANSTVLIRKDGSEVPIDDSGAPIRLDGKTVGVVLVFRDISERRRAELEQKRSEEASQFLSEASRLLHSSLDYEATLEHVSRMAVPILADYCVIDIGSDPHSFKRLPLAHINPTKEQVLREMALRYPPDPTSPRGVPQVLRSGKPELYKRITEETLRQNARDEDHFSFLRALGLRSAIVLPLVCRGRTVGALTLVWAESGREYDERDLAVAQALADRAALAIENAQLYRDLKKKASDLEVITDTAPVMIAQIDCEARYTFVNGAYAERFGLTPSQCAGRHIRDIVGEIAYQKMWPLAEQALSGTPVQVETDIEYAGLGRRSMYWSGAPLRDPSGEISGLIAAVQDITALKTAQNAQKKAEALAESILASSSDCFQVLSLEGVLEWLAPTASEVLECSDLRDMVGRHWQDFFKDSDREALSRAAEIARQGGQGRFEGFCPTFSGTPKWWDVVVAPIVGADGKPEKLLAVSRDITERKRTEDVLRRTEKLAASGRLAATIAHEINNPLEGVTNLLFLLRGRVKEEEGEKLLAMAEAELQRVSHITKQTLAFYRGTTTPETVRIGDILDNVISIFAKRIALKRIMIIRSDHPISIVAIRGELLQLLSNLVGNAIDAVGQHGHIQIAVAPKNDGVEVAISDDGKGIPPEHLPRLFEPFFTTKEIGTGLGLWVAQDIAQKHGGHIKVETSTSTGSHGTTFRVELPSARKLTPELNNAL